VAGRLWLSRLRLRRGSDRNSSRCAFGGTRPLARSVAVGVNTNTKSAAGATSVDPHHTNIAQVSPAPPHLSHISWAAIQLPNCVTIDQVVGRWHVVARRRHRGHLSQLHSARRFVSTPLYDVRSQPKPTHAPQSFEVIIALLLARVPTAAFLGWETTGPASGLRSHPRRVPHRLSRQSREGKPSSPE